MSYIVPSERELVSRIRKIQKPLFDEIRGHILEEMAKYCC